jgi:hypothetical protein
VQVVCSPKTPKLHPLILPHIDAYKYVVRYGYVDVDGLPNEEPQKFKSIPVAKPHSSHIPVYISPWDEKEIELLREECLKIRYELAEAAKIGITPKKIMKCKERNSDWIPGTSSRTPWPSLVFSGDSETPSCPPKMCPRVSGP